MDGFFESFNLVIKKNVLEIQIICYILQVYDNVYHTYVYMGHSSQMFYLESYGLRIKGTK